MIPLERIANLRRKSAEKARAFLERHAQKKVRIYSAQWGMYWRENRKGYTYSILDAGEYTFGEAYKASGHCGAEKGIYYDFIREA